MLIARTDRRLFETSEMLKNMKQRYAVFHSPPTADYIYFMKTKLRFLYVIPNWSELFPNVPTQSE